MKNKAIVYRKGLFGGYKAGIAEVVVPKPAKGHVLIKNEVLGLNYADYLVSSGKIKNPNHLGIMGVEGAGVVQSSGEGCVRQFKDGARVCYATFAPGAFAQYHSVHEDYLIPIPEGVSYFNAATLLKGLMAQLVLAKVIKLKPGSVVAVSAASGGVGSLICNLLAKTDVRVIGLTSKATKKPFLKDIGCDLAIDYKTESIKEVLAANRLQGVDYYYDAIGLELESQMLEALSNRSYIIQYANITGEFKAGPDVMRRKSLTISYPRFSQYYGEYPFFMATALSYLRSLKEGIVSPKIMQYKFQDYARALEEIGLGVTKGQKILIF